MLVLLLLLLLTADPADLAKLGIVIIVGLLVVLGGLKALATTIAQKDRKLWFERAAELMASSAFTKAVSEAREPIVANLISQMHGTIDEKIRTYAELHEANTYVHRPAIKHAIEAHAAFVEGTIERDLALLTKRVEALEKR